MNEGNLWDNRGMDKKIEESKIEYCDKGEVLAGVYFSCSEGSLHVDSTFVSPVLRGQGIGAKLMGGLLEVAEQKKLTISSSCSYATHYFQTHPTPLFKE